MGKQALVGCDLDGVVSDFLGACAIFALKDYGINIWPSIRRQKNSARVEEILKQYQYTIEMYAWMNPIPSAARVLRKISKFVELVYITGRPLSAKENTKTWLALHNFPQAKIINVRESKVPAIKRLGVDLFIEDRLKYAVPISRSGTKVYLLDVYDRLWKKLPPEITVFRSWVELELKLLEEFCA